MLDQSLCISHSFRYDDNFQGNVRALVTHGRHGRVDDSGQRVQGGQGTSPTGSNGLSQVMEGTTAIIEVRFTGGMAISHVIGAALALVNDGSAVAGEGGVTNDDDVHESARASWKREHMAELAELGKRKGSAQRFRMGRGRNDSAISFFLSIPEDIGARQVLAQIVCLSTDSSGRRLRRVTTQRVATTSSRAVVLGSVDIEVSAVLMGKAAVVIAQRSVGRGDEGEGSDFAVSGERYADTPMADVDNRIHNMAAFFGCARRGAGFDFPDQLAEVCDW